MIKADEQPGPARIKESAFLWRWYFGNAALLVLTILVPVWLKAANHRFHNYDLGIIAQALTSIRPGDLNPFLSHLNQYVFNNHFDPILIMVSPIARVLEPAYTCLLVEHLLILAAPLFVILLHRRGILPTQIAFFSITYLLLNRGIISAIDFPVHPTTWAMFFAVLLAYAAATQKIGLEIVAALLLMSCKEEFPFAVLVVGVCFVFCGRRRQGAILVFLSVLWAGIALGLRPRVLGPTDDFASRILTPVMTQPIGTLVDRLSDPASLRRLVQCILPFFPIVYWQVHKRIAPNICILAAALPLLAIRFVGSVWKFHYMAPVTAFFLAGVWVSGLKDLPRKLTILAVAITILGSIGPIRRDIKEYALLSAFCPGSASHNRLRAIDSVRAHLLRERSGRTLVEGNLSPFLARRGEVYQVGGRQRYEGNVYRFVFVEKPPHGDPWPLDWQSLETMIARWRQTPGSRIIRDDDLLFFAEGVFTE